jgi:hypothetical protein
MSRAITTANPNQGQTYFIAPSLLDQLRIDHARNQTKSPANGNLNKPAKFSLTAIAAPPYPQTPKLSLAYLLCI